jgi:hypothetical protein
LNDAPPEQAIPGYIGTALVAGLAAYTVYEAVSATISTSASNAAATSVAESGGGDAPGAGAPGAAYVGWQRLSKAIGPTSSTHRGAPPTRSLTKSTGGGPQSATVQNRALQDRSRLAGVQYAISRQLHSGNVEGAIETARNFWGINPRVRIRPDPELRDDFGRLMYAATTYYPTTGAATITIGAPATTDARSLLSTLLHENVHVTQGQGTPTNWAPRSRPTARAVNELEAFRAERNISSSLGLTEGHVRAIDAGVDYNESLIVGTEYESRVARRNYQLFDSDVITR